MPDDAKRSASHVTPPALAAKSGSMLRSMRLLHVIPSLDPRTGGPPVVVLQLAAAAARLTAHGGSRPYDTGVMTYAPRTPVEAEETRRSLQPFPEVAVHNLPPLTRVERFLARGARRRGIEIARGYDFLHLHGVWDPVILAAADVARRLGKPYCITLHGMLDPWAMAQRPWRKKIALRMGYRRMLDDAAFIHALNTDEADLIAPLGLTAPVEIAPNGIDPAEFAAPPDPRPFIDTLPQRHRSRRRVVFLGRLHVMKGVDVLLDAWAKVAPRHPDVSLIVAGPDYGHRAAIEAQLDRLALRESVVLTGPLLGAMRLSALRSADCFVLPSRREGFSMAVLEALACGTPAVLSRECHFPEVAQWRAGRVVELSPAAVAEGLSDMLSDPRSSEAGQRGRDAVMAHYTWPAIARRLMSAAQASQARAADPRSSRSRQS